MFEPYILRSQTIRRPITKNMFGIYIVVLKNDYAGILKIGHNLLTVLN